MDDNKFRVKIYGVRGSYPPLNGNGTEFGVNTTCLRVDFGKHLVIIDAGTGMIKLAFDLMNEMKSDPPKQNYHQLFLLFTHTHIDHLMGFPYFAPLYHPLTELNIISPSQLNYSIEEILETLMSPAFFPVTIAELPSRFNYQEFAENKQIYFYEDDFQLVSTKDAPKSDKWVGRLSCMRNYTHPKGGVYIYKFEDSAGHSVVFATDVEGFVGGDQRLTKFSQGADVLIHDAQYTLPEYDIFQGFGHSTFEMACEVAKKAGVGKLILSHHDPRHTDNELKDLESKAKNLFSETYIASETMEFSF